MPLNTSKRTAVEYRRQRVTVFRVDQGKTQREIAALLGVSLATINSDLKVLEARWRKAADIDVKAHRAHQLTELERIKRHAWLDPSSPANQRVLIQAILAEARITGTIQPPSIVFMGIFQQFVQALQDDPSVGESFAEWFKTFTAQKQQEGVIADGTARST